MHLSSYHKMESFKDKYLNDYRNHSLRICDFGSFDVNGSYRPIFTQGSWEYFGIDMAEGKNVDVVLKTPYVWKEIPSQSVDVVISGQAFEHTQYFWITILEIYRILKPGGYVCIIAPSSGPEHRYPMDCWRFYPDGMLTIGHFGGLEVLEAYTQWDDPGIPDGSDDFHDSVLVGRRPDAGCFKNLRGTFKRWLQHKVLIIGIPA